MKIGFIGLGKLGLPCAEAIAIKGHDVSGYDIADVESTLVAIKQSIKETVEYIKVKGPKNFDYAYPLEIITDKTPKTWSERLM